MFKITYDFTDAVIQFFLQRPYLLTLPKDFWSMVSLEWMALQGIFLYTYSRFIGYKNYYKQILSLLWLLMVMAVYLAFLQLELFACFMFLAEFTIIIFFYTLFLHLRIAATNQGARINPYTNQTIIFLIILLCVATYCGWSKFRDLEASPVFTDLYRRTSYIIFSDLSFFATTLLRTNYTVHLIVGILLLFLTLFLFFVTNIYYFLNITRRDAARQTASKLSCQRGYYEQTAEEVQKIISNKNK